MVLKHCLVDGGLAVVENYHFHRNSRRGNRATCTHEHIVAPGVGTGPFDVFHRIGAAADIAAEGGAAVAVGSPEATLEQTTQEFPEYYLIKTVELSAALSAEMPDMQRSYEIGDNISD